MSPPPRPPAPPSFVSGVVSRFIVTASALDEKPAWGFQSFLFICLFFNRGHFIQRYNIQLAFLLKFFCKFTFCTFYVPLQPWVHEKKMCKTNTGKVCLRSLRVALMHQFCQISVWNGRHSFVAILNSVWNIETDNFWIWRASFCRISVWNMQQSCPAWPGSVWNTRLYECWPYVWSAHFAGYLR